MSNPRWTSTIWCGCCFVTLENDQFVFIEIRIPTSLQEKGVSVLISRKPTKCKLASNNNISIHLQLFTGCFCTYTHILVGTIDVNDSRRGVGDFFEILCNPEITRTTCDTH